MKRCLLLGLLLTLASCGGGGGTESEKTVSISSVPQTTTAVQSCTNPHKSTYPDSYKGNYKFTPSNNKLETNFIRSIGLKDYYPGGEGPGGPHLYSNACQPYEYAKMLYRESLDKIKANGADIVWVYNYARWDNVRNDVMKISKTDQQIPDVMIEYIVTEAHKRGLKVYYNWMFDPRDMMGNTIYTPGKNIDERTLKQMLDSYHNHMIEVSTYAQKVGIDGLSADWSALYIIDVADEHREVWDNKMSLIIDDIRKNFSGRITYGAAAFSVMWYNPDLLNKVDYLNMSISLGTYTKADAPNVTLETLVKNAECSIQYQYMRMVDAQQAFYNVCPLKVTKANLKLPPVLWTILVQSHDRVLTHGWQEDGFCVPGKTDTGLDHNCIQETFTTDFSIQSMGIEALMQAIVKQEYFKTAGVDFSTGYWHTDEIASEVRRGFPNLSQSIRGKPSEAIVKSWFAR